MDKKPALNLDTFKRRLLQFAVRVNGHPYYREEYNNFQNDLDLFLDESYQIYLDANADERKEIRQIIKDYDKPEKDIHEGDPSPIPLRYHLRHSVIRTVKQLKLTGDITWLVRGLVIISIMDGTNSLEHDEERLSRLYVGAEEKGINPEPIFQKIAKASSIEIIEFRETSTSELIANIYIKAHKIVKELRSWKVID